MRKEKMKVARAPRILARLSARGFALTLAIHGWVKLMIQTLSAGGGFATVGLDL